MVNLVAVALLAAAAGLSQTPPAVKPAIPKAAHTRTPAPAATTLSDAEIEKDIRARLARSKIAADRFEVHVQGGVATLTGETDVIQHKGVATRMANSAGATRVVNNIRISEAARAKALENLTKGRRRVQIKREEARSERR